MFVLPGELSSLWFETELKLLNFVTWWKKRSGHLFVPPDRQEGLNDLNEQVFSGKRRNHANSLNVRL